MCCHCISLLTIKIIPDSDCTLKGFQYVVDNLTMKDALSPAMRETINEACASLERQEQMFEAMNDHLEVKIEHYTEGSFKRRHAQQVSVFPNDVRDDVAYSHVTGDLFPCMLLCLGSSAKALKVGH